MKAKGKDFACGTYAISRQRRPGVMSRMFSPSRKLPPDVHGSIPIMLRSSVVLPTPFGPRTART